ncbi:interferon phi 1 isoform X2 [Syngnathoides biaculeatus]|uniref:interferon phi 1 isoform X2 n=1 Tax=Syngnathoides biaculeatus TaxID=300417 RepID=UPI002ADE5BBC|nr:interferon phi 1 isoform X2 [Syngnathoides biaculeatus]
MLGVARAQVVLVVFGALASALRCNWLRRYTDLSNECLILLRGLGGPITQEEFPLPFPRKLYRLAEKSQAACKVTFVRDSLGHLLDLYLEADPPRVGWHPGRVDDLLNILYRQKDELNSCLPPGKAGCFSQKLRRYYKRLSRAAFNGTVSGAGWELIRSETKMHLQQLHLLVAAM